METEQAVTVDTLKSLLEAFNRHDLDEVKSFFGDHPVSRCRGGRTHGGTQHVLRFRVARAARSY